MSNDPTNGGLILWYRNCREARTAYEGFQERSKPSPPPVDLTVELADLDGFEMGHCVAIRTASEWERPVEQWLAELKNEPGEQEIEAGPEVMAYYANHAKILESFHLRHD